MSPAADTVALVGDRRAALRAARAAGLSIVQIVADADTPPRRGVAHRLVLAPDAPPGAFDDTVRSLARLRPRAILGLTESSVLTAARLRAALGGAATGSGEDPLESARRCTDKLVMKQAVRAAGIPCAEFVAGDDRIGGPELVERLGVPIFVKPRVGSGGRGARWVGPGAPIDFVLPVGWLAERAVGGTEMSVEAVVRDGAPLFVNFTEYLEPRWANVVPAAITASLDAALRTLLQRALSALGVRDGFVHMEVFVGDGEPVFGELACRPPGGHIMELIELTYGFDPWRALFDVACGREPRLDPRTSRVAAVRLIHPGPGVVTAVDVPPDHGGAVRVLVEPGDWLEPRLGSGQEAAHVIVAGDDRQAVVERLETLAGRVRIGVRPD